MGTKRSKTVTGGTGSTAEGTSGEGGGKALEEAMAPAERLVTQLAHVRAKFAMDPVDPQQALADAWTSPSAVREEDEAEYVDAVADCLGAGLPLEAALSCWDSGELAADQDDGDDDESSVAVDALARHTPTGRRLVVR